MGLVAGTGTLPNHLGFRAALLALFLALSWAAQAHLGAEIHVPEIQAPSGVVETEKGDVLIEWIFEAPDEPMDMDMEEPIEGDHVFRFYWHAQNAPPSLVADAGYLEDGVVIGDAPYQDGPGSLLWATAGVPTGAYHVFVKALDPPSCDGVAYAPALVVVRAAGESVPLGAHFTMPGADVTPVEGEAVIEIEAVGGSQPHVRLEAGGLWPAKADGSTTEYCEVIQMTFDPKLVVAEDLPMSPDAAAGPDRWRLTYTWDTSQVAPDYWTLRATVWDEAGSEIVVFPRGWYEVLEGSAEPQAEPVGDASDAGDTAQAVDMEAEVLDETGVGPDQADAAAPPPDAATPAPSPPDSGGCSLDGNLGGAWWWVAAMAWLVVVRRSRSTHTLGPVTRSSA